MLLLLLLLLLPPPPQGKIGEHKAVLRELGKLAKTKEEISKAKFAGNKELQGLLQSVQEVCKSCWAANKSFSLYNEVSRQSLSPCTCNLAGCKPRVGVVMVVWAPTHKDQVLVCSVRYCTAHHPTQNWSWHITC